MRVQNVDPCGTYKPLRLLIRRMPFKIVWAGTEPEIGTDAANLHGCVVRQRIVKNVWAGTEPEIRASVARSEC